MMTFIYIIMFIALYIAFGITIFRIGYKYYLWVFEKIINNW